MDIIKDLGELAFASRLKRLSERLQRDVSRIYKALNVEFESRWFPILFVLSKRSPLPVTELAQTLGLTHTAVILLSQEMNEKKLLLSMKDRKDERKRLLRLSKKGKEVAAALRPAWKEIRRATKELIQTSGTDMLASLEKIERLLDQENMYERVQARMKTLPSEKIDFVEYRPAYKKHFRALNAEWLQAHFTIEKADEDLLADPNGRIIKKGGAILFAKTGDQIVGTCALVKHSDEIFELTKMAVAPKFRGRKIGWALAHKVLQRSRAMKARILFLETSPKLVPALKIYEKLGFRKARTSPVELPKYKRKTIVMKLRLRQ